MDELHKEALPESPESQRISSLEAKVKYLQTVFGVMGQCFLIFSDWDISSEDHEE